MIAASEYDEQKAVIQWAKGELIVRRRDGKRGDMVVGGRVIDYLYAIPNGAALAGSHSKRARQVSKLKATGFKTGASDLHFTVPVGIWHSLYLEMKMEWASYGSDAEAKRAIKPDQLDFLTTQGRVGHLCIACYGADAAIAVLEGYISGELFQDTEVWPHGEAYITTDGREFKVIQGVQ